MDITTEPSELLRTAALDGRVAHRVGERSMCWEAGILPQLAEADGPLLSAAERIVRGIVRNDIAAVPSLEAVREAVETDANKPATEWTDAELDHAIVTLCDEMPPPRMVTCWRAREYCRQHTTRGAPASLLVAMRQALRLDMENMERHRRFPRAA